MFYTYCSDVPSKVTANRIAAIPSTLIKVSFSPYSAIPKSVAASGSTDAIIDAFPAGTCTSAFVYKENGITDVTIPSAAIVRITTGLFGALAAAASSDAGLHAKSATGAEKIKA